ncbi:MAG: hypothetical protein JW912_04110 [Sedimentisphaerales bacterium]|nr:hypothetical protein [Sedimentisphaerales bacterium]
MAVRAVLAGLTADAAVPVEVVLLVGTAETFTGEVCLPAVVALDVVVLAVTVLGEDDLVTVVLGAVALAVDLDALFTVLAEDTDLVAVAAGRDCLAVALGTVGVAALGAAAFDTDCLAVVAGLDAAAAGAVALGAALLPADACLCLPAAYKGEMNTTRATKEIASRLLILYFDTNIMNLHSVLPDLSCCKTGMVNDRLYKIWITICCQ